MSDEEQPTAQQQSSISINMLQEGIIITIPVGIQEETMNMLVFKWLESHPALVAQITKQALAAKQAELSVIQNISKSKR